MKVLVAGATGARPVVADALDPDAVARAVAAAEPEAIVAVNSVVNPDKLGHLGRVGDMRALLRGDR